MHKAMRLAIVAVTLVTLVVLTVAASALAVTSSDTQITAGIHQRTIWDTTQVMTLKLTKDGTPGVNHTGYIHLELKFKPTTSDLDLYLLDSKGNVLSEEMGCMGIFAGKEFVDHQVTAVDNQDIIESATYGDDEYMVGDVYYVVIVAFNGTAEYQVWGYYPQIDLEQSEDVEEPYNYYLQQYRYPASATSWGKITGPRYGGPYDFKPTSAGTGACALQWPAAIIDGTWQVTYERAKAPMPFNVEQYLYAGSLWDEVLANWGTEENYYPDDQGGWYGFNDEFEVAESKDEAEYSDAAWAQGVAHYVPSLFLAYEDATLGPDGPLKLGLRKMGYKATLTWPENLWLRKVTKYSTYYLVSGRYSLDGAAMPVGSKVEIWKKTATTGWKYLKTVKTIDDGKGTWSVKLKPGVTWTIQARAAGNPATGLDIEKSLTRVLKAL